MRIPVILFVIIILLSSCMSSIHLTVLHPADITVSGKIKTLAVVNRSFPDEKAGHIAGNILEGVLSGEGILTDREASRNCITGFKDELTKAPRFKVVQPATELGGTGMPYFPAPLPWNEVEQICSQTKADVLVTLEMFDSDIFTDGKVDTVIEKDKEGKEIKKPVYNVQQEVHVISGWRIYDPKNKIVIDEFKDNQHIRAEKSGKSPSQAESKLPASRGAVEKAGWTAGSFYGIRVSPHWITLSRSYFTKGKGDNRMKMAANKAQKGDWKSASELWLNIIKDENSKASKRAAYNMIVACEKEGRLDLALEWANKAAYEYKIGAAKNYISQLKARMADNQRLKEQMGE